MDPSFEKNRPGLTRALDLLFEENFQTAPNLPHNLIESGMGEHKALEFLAPLALGRATPLDDPGSFAHMDPPTPWITWAISQWNARLNQNLLHPDLAPFARIAERFIIRWLTPFFGLEGGHMTSGSTLANLTALWVAREVTGSRHIIASTAAHLSIYKAAQLLGMQLDTVEVDATQRLNPKALTDRLSNAILVLTAGTTGAGMVDPLNLCGQAAWTHVDAAWAGPLIFSDTHRGILAGINKSDSISISAHKWLFQPKEAALILFRDEMLSHDVISFGSGYLAEPNIGILGSHGAVAISLVATLLAWGRKGLAERIDSCMNNAVILSQALSEDANWHLFTSPETGVVVFRPSVGQCEDVITNSPRGLVSTTLINGEQWLRAVAANPNADIQRVLNSLNKALGVCSDGI